ncbi:iron-sulfur cluster-binding sigma-54-dependent transcriptional regulator, FehydlgC and FeS domain-containing [Syntrophotalea carbinolica DSM 2380]|uniref:Iron-sulfur cluster-binding sigma-54-dependent transcriptional regulator, FehydlgC and FeS domain-containing n=1 Tax=Syntrophotalea carbinolica (strain DSM 2380 / NBRC 103641 / GraBd1) TaxID=338963 RepID=Q3A256_SYNC1|nr:[Fe-Fe] hydrogenase large subunit C-terminal domain-containing protein [Syntrophotalea carbinolica]ABA89551.1 iron-sulfur cluster-binding sigma-54-dependent transcriptional regulator, FehydlgC and FeS domain-containing [Syntrophotalea carbinolica DSM 2380]
MGHIQTDTQRCRRCYACVRHCPVKAIRVTRQGTDLSPGRCIGCGRCLQICTQQARHAVKDLERCRRLLKRREPMAALLAPSFPAYLGDMRPGQMIAGLRQLGFGMVIEGAWGVELLAGRLKIEPSTRPQTPTILSHCPAVIALVERHFPQLLRNMAPQVSPLPAAARALRAAHAGPLRVVTISSCFAAKLEAVDDQFQDTVDAALTFSELSELFEESGITPTLLSDAPFDGTGAADKRLFPVTGGALATLLPDFSGDTGVVLSAEGPHNALDILRDLAAGRIRPSVVDLRLCRGGCTGPCDSASRLSPFARSNLVQEFARQPQKHLSDGAYLGTASGLSLERTFSNRQPLQEHPSGENIRRVLHSTDKFAQRDELNCGACGYDTCREHATAVCRNLALEDMCLPYFVKRLEAEKLRLERALQLARHVPDDTLIGSDAPMRQILELAQELAPGDKPILLRGEAGTGKETLARIIHRRSHRSEQPLATVNCTALGNRQLKEELFGGRPDAKKPQGLLELAAGSSLLLDEIGDASLEVQQALLDWLNREKAPWADVRLIVTSHRDLEQGIREGWFNSELFFRLSLCTLTLPPLRNRLDALPELARQQLQRASRRYNKKMVSIDPLAQETLNRYHWPGNLRELASVIERAVALSEEDVLHQEHLNLSLTPAATEPPSSSTETTSGFRARRGHQMEMIERDLLERYLREACGNVSAAARRANLPRRSFYRLMERYGIKRRQFVNRRRSEPKP